MNNGYGYILNLVGLNGEYNLFLQVGNNGKGQLRGN